MNIPGRFFSLALLSMASSWLAGCVYMDDYPPPYMVGGIVGGPPPPNYRMRPPPPGYRRYYNNDDGPMPGRGYRTEDPLSQTEPDEHYAPPPRDLPNSSRNPPVMEPERPTV